MMQFVIHRHGDKTGIQDNIRSSDKYGQVVVTT